jgi:hypothetical protein
MTSGAPCTPVQLSIDLSNPDSSNKSNADSIPPLTERASSSNPSNSFISNLLTPQEKVALFAALFAWRRDAYAIRWENSSTGAHGYKPARDHDYSTHKYSPKEKRKPCPGPPECPDFTLINEALKHHLQGKETIGVYPMLEGDTCMFLAIDLDQKNQNRIAKCSKTTQPWSGHAPAPKRELNNDQDQSFSVSTCNSWSWQDDAQSLMHAAGSMNVPAYLERSRSGKGGHLWIFFASPVLAAMARRLGEAMITKAIHDTGQLHLRSYDRMFPNQDNAPQKGYGNLIALPLQKGPLAHGNSAFLDETMTPYPDQWKHWSGKPPVRMPSFPLHDQVKTKNTTRPIRGC